MMVYVSNVLSVYRDQANLANILNYEASNTYLNIVSFDNHNNVLWILLKKLDNSNTNYFIAIDNSTHFLSCSSVSIYNPSKDLDGIICSEANECPTAKVINVENVYVPWEEGLSDFISYAKAKNFVATKPTICMVENVCNYMQTPGVCGEPTLVRISLPPQTSSIRVYTIYIVSNNAYVVGVYEVSLR